MPYYPHPHSGGALTFSRGVFKLKKLNNQPKFIDSYDGLLAKFQALSKLRFFYFKLDKITIKFKNNEITGKLQRLSAIQLVKLCMTSDTLSRM